MRISGQVYMQKDLFEHGTKNSYALIGIMRLWWSGVNCTSSLFLSPMLDVASCDQAARTPFKQLRHQVACFGKANF